jgi:RNA polymerase sigma factor (sigma-70 family)
MTTTIVKNWRAIYSRVRSALLRRGRTPHEAEDLVQEAWVRMACYERNHAIEQPEAFLMRTALNLSIDAHRMRISHGEEVMVEDVVLIDVAPSVDDVVLAKERLARLSLCLGRLSPKTRDIFLSYRVEDMTYQEIASRHGLSISTVEKHVARATLRLAEWMDGW